MADPGIERRRTPRIPVGDALTVTFHDVPLQLTPVNVGSGGFAIATTEWLPDGNDFEATFQTPDRRWSATFSVRLTYAILNARRSGPWEGKFIAGFAFRRAKQPAVKKQIKELLEHVAAVPA